MMQIPESLTKDTVLKYVDEQSIFEYYLGHKIELKTMYFSPFRKEANPSFNIYINRYNGRLWFKDHASVSGDCFRLVQHLHNDCNFMDALKIIDRDFNLNIESSDITLRVKLPEKQVGKAKEFNIQITKQNYTKTDIHLWNEILETKDIISYLKFFKVFSAKHTWINDFKIEAWNYTEENPVYAYYDQTRFKLYRPNEKDRLEKWKNNLLPEQWLGYKQLPEKGDLLIITKSYKDVIFLRRLGIYAIAINGENHSFPPSLLNELKLRFEKVIIWFDNDETGILNAKQKAEEFGITYVHIPEGEPKDPTDFKLEYGMEETENLLHELCLI